MQLFQDLIIKIYNSFPWETYTSLLLIPLFFSIKFNKVELKKYTIYLLIISSFSIGLYRVNDDNPFKPSFSLENVSIDKTNQYIYNDPENYFIKQSYLAFGRQEVGALSFSADVMQSIQSDQNRIWPPTQYVYSIKNITEFLLQKTDCPKVDKTTINIEIDNEQYEYRICLN